MAVTIREARADDAETIAEFNSRLAAETEGISLDEKTIGPGVRRLLDDRTRGRYWVAEADGRVIGQIMVTSEWSDWRNGMLWWIQSVYVMEDARRKGVFSALYRHVESQARSDPDACGLRLYVESSNRSAQRTYETLGMKMTDYRVMETLFNGED